MLKQSKRLHGRKHVGKLIKDGEEIQGRYLIVRKIPNNLEFNRYGVNISKKLEKKAVIRNKLRRRIYEIIRLMEKEGHKGSSSDIMLFAKKSLLKLNFIELEVELKKILQNI